MKNCRRKYAFSQGEGRWELQAGQREALCTPTAEIWGAAIIGIGALGGAYLSSEGAKNAGDAAADASGEAIGEQRRQFDTLLSLTAPQRNIGNQALATLGGIYGYSPTRDLTGGNLLTGPTGSAYTPSIAPGNIQDSGVGRHLTRVFNPAAAVGNRLGVNPNSTFGKILDPLGGLFGSKHGDEKRNINAFMQAFPDIRDIGNGMLMLPDGTQIPQSELQNYAGTWYGATFAPDGDQEGWQQKFDALRAKYPAQASGNSLASGGRTYEYLPDGSLREVFGPPGAAAGAPSGGNALTAPDYSAFFKSPDYNFRMTEGLNTVQNSAAAEGGLYSGNALRGITEYGQGVAAGGFNDWFANQLALAGIGTGASSQAGQGAIATGANVGNLLMNQGNARASGIQGQSDAWANLINQLGLLGGYKFGGLGG